MKNLLQKNWHPNSYIDTKQNPPLYHRTTEIQAHTEFFLNETNYLGAVLDTETNKPHGNPQKIVLIGQWKYHFEKGIYVRSGFDFRDLTLVRSSEPYKTWRFEIRIGSEEKAFMKQPFGPFVGYPSLETLEEDIPLVRSIVDSVIDYYKIVQARER